MKRDFDMTSRKAVAITIGAMKDEESYYGLLGTVVATAILGKIPSREDRASFMGTSETKIARLVKDAVDFAYYDGDLKTWFNGYTVGCPSVTSCVYALATQVVANGFYVGDNQEPESRYVARTFLNNYFRPQAIQNAQDFAGYQMVLEYLWYTIDSPSITDYKKFVKHRYSAKTPANKVQGFCDIIANFAAEKQELETLLTEKGKYNSVIRGLLYELIAEDKTKGKPEI
ncbi:hypothetical protein IKE07_02590 [Candidatus Saccharibacteria bacterium]|nr:hypothetical protein [Candidatus Saccharibacteria bacterium]